MLSRIGAGVVVSLLVTGMPVTDPDPPGCRIVDALGRCLVIAVDPGRGGLPTAPGREESERRTPRERSQNGSTPAPATPPPPNTVSLPFGDGGWVQTPQSELDALLDALPGDGQGPAAGAVTPEVLAARAIELLTIEPPVVHTSAGGTGFVGLPVWLWIDAGGAATGPLVATATAGASRVTATGRLSAVEWSMGPPGEVVRCDVPGTPWTGQDGPSPDCGYVYALRSLPERTGGAGAWTVTATAVWTVTWSGANGGVPVEGEETVLVPTTTTMPVGEVQVLVGGGHR